MATTYVNESALAHLSVGDFVAILTHHMKDGKVHWTLGSVETPPYLRDVEIRLWERQRVEYYDEEDTPANPETAELMKRIAQVKEDLQKSIDQTEGLTQQLRDRRAAIMQQIGEADTYVAESRAVRDAARDDVESISDRYWQELKSYRIPPKMVLVVIRAVMLLLSEDEARTWPQMQRVLRDFNFKRRVTGYDPDHQLSSERRDYILQECVSKKSFRYDRAMQGSVAVGPIYYWVLAQLDCGEAQSQKDRVDQEKIARQKELRGVLKQISEQQKRITEYQELMDDLDDQLRLCKQRNSEGASAIARSRSQSISRSRRRLSASDRYAESFAAREGKEYLRPAFYTWRPTDRVIIVLRKNIVCNFNAVTSQEQQEGYNMSDPQIRMLDGALMRRQQALAAMGDDDQEREDAALEEDMFRQNDAEARAAQRNDEEILQERQRNAAEGMPTPIPTPQANDVDAAGVAAAEATARLKRIFEGKNWQRILDRKRDAIEAAFTEESAECLDVPEYYISIDDLTLGSLIVAFSAQHDGQRSDAELQGRVNAFGYPKVLSLYEEDDEEDEDAGAEHQMKFGGDCWADIAPAHQAEIRAAFLADTSAATGAPRGEIAVHDIRVEADEGLSVDYSMLDKSRDPDEVQRQVDAYAYPEVWALYQQLAGLGEAGPIHQVRFRGERWVDIMAGAAEEIRQAFAEDTADALGIAPRQVSPAEIRYDGGLTVPYTVSGCLLDDDAVDAKAEDYNYPKTWALYDRLVAEAVGAAFQKSFEGVHWETVLHAARPEVSEAFCTDTANAVKSEPYQVDPRSVDTDQDRLLVSYNVGDSKQRPDDVKADTREYPYPEVWALYQQVMAEEAEGTRNLSQTFDGDAWAAINAAIPALVREAFAEDVAVATRADPASVTVHDIKTSKKGMTVEYGISRLDGQSAYAMRKAAKDFDYPVTWSLYEANKDTAAPRGLGGAGERESSILERRFDGDDWDILVDGCPEDLNDAFRADAARTLGVPKQNVRIISTAIGSLIVKYQIVDPPHEDDEIAQRLEEDEFPEVMGLYRRRIRGGDEGGEEGATAAAAAAAPKLHDLEDMPAKDFPGDEWSVVAADHRAKLEQAFAKDTADALGITAEQVIVKEAVADAFALRVDYSVLDCPCDAVAAQAAVEDYPYPEVWELYPEAEAEEDLGRYVKTFDGTAWEEVAATRPDALREAFAQDAAAALETEQANIAVKSIHATGEQLTVRYNVADAACDEAKAEAAHDEYAYPNTWALYEPSAEEQEAERDWVTTSHQVGFDGDDWGYVVQDKMPELQAAFTRCTAELFHLRAEHVRNARYAIGSLLVDFDLAHPAALTEEAINAQLLDCPYEPVWDLYGHHPWDPKEVTETTHEVGFEGAGWATVLETQRDELEVRFKQDTAEALDVEAADVHIDSTDFTEDCLFIRTTVTHHIFQDGELMQEQLSRYPYEEVWKLYVEDPELTWSTTSHQVGFDGDDWRYIAAANKAPLEQAFRTCTGEALDLTDENIMNVTLEASETALLATFDVKHPKEQSEAEVNEKLAACDYMAVWALYIDHPFNPDELVTTSHEVGFEGEEWDKVRETQPEQLSEAIMLDTADALEVTPNDITSITTTFENGSILIVRLDIQHPVLQDEELIKEQLGRFPYERVWALYEDAPVTPLSEDVEETAAPRGLGGAGERESSILERRFDGDDWDILVDGCPEDLNDAFRADAARTLGVPKQNVRIISTAIGSLIVKYQIVDPPHEDDEIAQRLEEDEFPEVMGLYRRRIRGGDEGGEEGATAAAAAAREVEAEESEAAAAAAVAPLDDDDAAAHAKEFPGDNWEECLRNSRGEIEQAFVNDTADAAGVAAARVSVRAVTANEEGMRVTYDVAPAEDEAEAEDGQERADEGAVAAAVEAYPYPSVWALYQDETITTAHALSFESPDWGYIVRRRRWELARAISDDSAEATGLLADAIVDAKMEAHDDSLAATVYITHARTLAAEDIDQRLSDAPFERVWALYELLAPSSELTKSFKGERWAEVAAEQTAILKRAFVEDTAKAVSVSRLEVEVRQTAATPETGLAVSFVVRGSSLQDAEMAEATRRYAYPTVWSLYGGEAAGQRDFAGDKWAAVLEDRRAEAEEAFREDTANALGVPHDAVEVCQILADESGLHVQYAARSSEAAEEAEQQQQQTPAQEDGGVVTAAEAQTVAQKVSSYDYPRLWSLYESCNDKEGGAARGFGGAGDRESGQLQRVFEGDDWDVVLDGCPEEANGAFRKGVADSTHVSPSDVVVTDARLGSLIMDYKVRNCDMEDEEINEKVAAHDFPELMALYRARMRSGDGGEEGAAASRAVPVEEVIPIDKAEEAELPAGYARVALSVSFEGELWEQVVKARLPELTDAMRSDTAKSISAAPEDIHIRECVVSAEGLLMHFSARYEESTPEAELRRKVDEYPFDDVWALYDAVEEAQAAAMSATLTRRFDGVNWDLAMETYPERVAAAFKEDTADVLQVDLAKVFVDDIALGSLVVQFRVQGLAITAQKAQTLADNYAYPKVWALYIAREAAPHDAAANGHTNGNGNGHTNGNGNGHTNGNGSSHTNGDRSGHSSSRPSARRTEQLQVEEGVESQDTVTYLRKALADARRERDVYMEQVEQAEEAQRSSQKKR
ncbi:microtubule-associated protein [Novymonas esmeraldas]|uniref:Microtubule-associated protein n=1 Tax=Novymonas esmeraldas TaxID=1808958 RepID=A0AAW0EM35_9TRYP